MIQSWRLDAPGQTLLLSAQGGRLACVTYWGPRLPDAEDLNALAAAQELDVAGGMLDANPELSICPEAERSFPGQPGLVLADAQGAPMVPRLRYAGETAAETALTLRYADADLGLRYAADFAIDARTGILEMRATLEADRPMRLRWLAAPVLPAPQHGDEMIDLSGRWCGEFQVNRVKWSPGARLRESRTGRSGHENFPGLILPAPGATNTQGTVCAFHYGWSGGHRMIAEELPDGRRQIQFGHAADSEPPATRFETATLYAARSETGLNGCAAAFQRHLRDRIIDWPDAARPRPLHYNCWEAVYFDHDLAELKDIASRAAALGAERFVLDDGWFAGRNDDATSLGDWRVDGVKYPDGLGPLIAHVQAEGMTFGLWFEPEMISEDSDLFRAHPEWRLGDAAQIPGRRQYCLDMANPDLRAHLHDRISALLSEYAIDYVKWDHNRVLPAPDAAQTRGTYALLDRLRAEFPETEIESCASGGGRIDFGILRRTQRVWLSDSNDALERLRMQHEAALFLPMAATGSHVGPRDCHSSGRSLNMGFRAWVAAQRHMGLEMDPRELTGDEAATLKRVTAWWKLNRGWMRDADILRLDSADPVVIAEQQNAADGARFVVFAGKSASSAQIAPRPLRLTGLAPQARYRIELINRKDAPALLSRGSPLLKTAALEASGQYLMAQGVVLPWSFPETMWVLEGTRL